ncbi:hypothetical protein DWU98_09980 [Dyella monticola]|uniref:Uncharacterized protein n=1 Tax=Dyella monticola TaxID=1927958 RepID=A0A370WZY2_9GAMM|nr:hypothetical protein DWU98_09980 [Dyella monticola]
MRKVGSHIQHLVKELHRTFRHGGEEFAASTHGLAMKNLCQLAEGSITPRANHKLALRGLFGIKKI